MWWKKYEPLLEQKPQSGVDAIKDLMAKELCELLDAFPPAEQDVVWEDARLAAKLSGRLAELPKVDGAFVDVLARVLALDLSHETEQIDHMMRNDLHRAGAPTALHVEALHLLWRAVLEHLYTRKEEAKGLLKGRDLVDVVERMRLRFRRVRT